jgi:capsular exopolysaccharide synthesis family protein
MTEKKAGIEWHSIVRDLLRNIWVIFCAAVIGILGTYVVKHVVYNPEYTSRATVIINSAAGKANAVQTLAQSSEIAQIYAEVFVQPTMQQKVCEYLGKESFDGRIGAKVNKGTNIMDISVTADNPEEAYRELKALLKVYPQITSTLYTNGVVSVLRPAGVPKSPSNSMTSTSALKTAAAAMILAAAVIVLFSILRDTVKNESDFEDKIDARLLGTIPHERKHLGVKDILRGKKKGILFSESAFTSLKFTENFNKLASKFEYLKRTKDCKVFAITSVAENEGKSTVASNLALSLAIKGNVVVLLDLDGKKPALYKIFEQEPDDSTELGLWLSGEADKKDFKFRRYKKTNLFLALNTRPHREYARWIESGNIKKVFKALKKSADYIIVDTAPVSVDGTVTGITALSDAAVLTVRTDCVYTPIINDTILTLKNTGANFAGCILNDVYEEFSFFSQFGTDEGGYSRYSKYSGYSKYSNYSAYGRYSKYGRYQSPAGLEETEITPENMPKISADKTEDGGKV